MFPVLPLHIIRVVFERTARNNIEAAKRLVQVSHLVQHWIDPILYATPVLLRERSRRAFLRTISTSKRNLVSATVHSLCISFDPTTDCVPNILLACPEIHDLTIYAVRNKSWNEVEFQISSWNFKKLRWALNLLRPRRVQIQLRALSTSHADPILQLYKSFFLSTTHLAIMDSWECWTTWSNFELLSSLTHLSLDLKICHLHLGAMNTILRIIDDFLERCTRLKLCIVIISPLGVSKECIQNALPRIQDQKLVFLYDTEPLFRADMSIWGLAENICNSRKVANMKYMNTMIYKV